MLRGTLATVQSPGAPRQAARPGVDLLSPSLKWQLSTHLGLVKGPTGYQVCCRSSQVSRKVKLLQMRLASCLAHDRASMKSSGRHTGWWCLSNHWRHWHAQWVWAHRVDGRYDQSYLMSSLVLCACLLGQRLELRAWLGGVCPQQPKLRCVQRKKYGIARLLAGATKVPTSWCFDLVRISCLTRDG